MKVKIKGIEFSEETIVGWAEKAGVLLEKPKFEPISIHLSCFEVSVFGNRIKIKNLKGYPTGGCLQYPNDVDEFIAALQSAKAFAIANK